MQKLIINKIKNCINKGKLKKILKKINQLFCNRTNSPAELSILTVQNGFLSNLVQRIKLNNIINWITVESVESTNFTISPEF